MKAFAKLTQTHVRIEVADGASISVPMLPVAKLPELNDLAAQLAKAGDVETVQGIRLKMVDMAKTCLPEQYHANLARFDVDMLARLLAYLMYGDGDDQPEKN